MFSGAAVYTIGTTFRTAVLKVGPPDVKKTNLFPADKITS
jgi:hypothetical protein